VLDLHLPEVSGSEILAAIRANASLAHTKVVLATADHLTAESLREDADLVLLKPISFKQLRDLSGRLHRKRETIQHLD
jgi:CheY-like chemotaxis protein